jgi:hypothetical protein
MSLNSPQTIRKESSQIHNCDLVDCLKYFDTVNHSADVDQIQVVTFIGFSSRVFFLFSQFQFLNNKNNNFII